MWPFQVKESQKYQTIQFYINDCRNLKQKRLYQLLFWLQPIYAGLFIGVLHSQSSVTAPLAVDKKNVILYRLQMLQSLLVVNSNNMFLLFFVSYLLEPNEPVVQPLVRLLSAFLQCTVASPTGICPQRRRKTIGSSDGAVWNPWASARGSWS